MLIYLIDDHKMFAEAMSTIIGLNCQGAETRIFHSGVDALKALKDETPQLIVLDLDMPELSGIRMLDIFAQHGKDIPVLVCSGNLSTQNIQAVLRAGAKGYLCKSEDSATICDAIAQVSQGHYYPPAAETLAGEDGAAVTPLLSRKQLVILSLMKSGMSNSDMADTLFLSTNTIKTHIRLMYTTLDVNSRIECLNKAEELNLLSE